MPYLRQCPLLNLLSFLASDKHLHRLCLSPTSHEGNHSVTLAIQRALGNNIWPHFFLAQNNHYISLILCHNHPCQRYQMWNCWIYSQRFPMAYIRELTCISASLDFNFDATQSQLGNAEISDAILVHWDGWPKSSSSGRVNPLIFQRSISLCHLRCHHSWHHVIRIILWIMI